jgi:NAD-specific glutamate dehydrogenase
LVGYHPFGKYLTCEGKREMNARRFKIEQLVKFYKEHYKDDYRDAVKHAKEVRKTKANVFGSDVKKEFRHEFSMPAKLFKIINDSLDTPFLKENSEATWFRKTFPEFSGQEKW